MKNIFITLITFLAFNSILAQEKLYNPKDNATIFIQEAVAKAAKEGKHVFLQIGGNWCVWCIRFNNFIKENHSLDSMMNKNYVVYHLNWSPENKNEKVLEELEYPQRFGFPVFVILDEKGKRLHTQDSALLEEGDSYNKDVVMNFLSNWTRSALLPENNKY